MQRQTASFSPCNIMLSCTCDQQCPCMYCSTSHCCSMDACQTVLYCTCILSVVHGIDVTCCDVPRSANQSLSPFVFSCNPGFSAQSKVTNVQVTVEGQLLLTCSKLGWLVLPSQSCPMQIMWAISFHFRSSSTSCRYLFIP